MGKIFQIFLILCLLCLVQSQLSKDFLDNLRDFSKSPESYLEKASEKLKEKIVQELLKFTLHEYLNSSSTNDASKIHNANFGNIRPLINFFYKINLTNHTLQEIEQFVWESIPIGYNASNFMKIQNDSKQWAEFADKFLKNFIIKISSNATDFFNQIFEKIQEHYKVATNSNQNITKVIGELSSELLKNKDLLSDVAKKIHSQIKSSDESKEIAQSNEESEIKHKQSYIAMTVLIFVVFLVILLVVALILRRYYRKRQINFYNQMETSQIATVSA